MKTKFLSIVVILVAVVIAVILIVLGRDETLQNKSGDLLGQEVPVLGKTHVPEGIKVTTYNSNPPTSGDHWPQSAEWGIYLSPLPDEQLVHNLEHGGIWISYKDIETIDEETGKKLDSVANKFPQEVIITERPENEAQFAMVSWGRLYTSDTFDQEFAEKFIKANINNSPEKLARLEQLATAVGRPFPNFSVTEVGGRTITNESLKRKPAIIWFTTEFCVPCQIGAIEVSKLDDKLGGSAFEILVIFVDSRETNQDLISWRNRFARDDWMVAFDNFDDGPNSLAAKIGLKFLDSKYLLNSDGIIQNIDFQIADENYLNIIREIVKANQ